jgi:hypothetical protein
MMSFPSSATVCRREWSTKRNQFGVSFAIAFALSLLVSGSVAWANKLTSSDKGRSSALAEKALQLAQDVDNLLHGIGAIGSIENPIAFDCLITVGDKIYEYQTHLTFVNSLVSIETSMESASDDNIVIDELKYEINLAYKQFSNSRNTVNKLYYHCSNRAPGFQKSADALLRLYDQARELLESVNSRL